MTLTRRVFGLCFALWFTFVVAEPIPFHACAMHNPLVLMQDASAQKASAQTMLAAAALEGPASSVYCNVASQPTGHAEHGHSTSHQGQSHHQCNCLGCCAGTASLVVPAMTGIVPIPVRLAAVRVAYSIVERTIAEPDFLLPPSTAPPALA